MHQAIVQRILVLCLEDGKLTTARGVTVVVIHYMDRIKSSSMNSAPSLRGRVTGKYTTMTPHGRSRFAIITALQLTGRRCLTRLPRKGLMYIWGTVTDTDKTVSTN